MFQQCILSKIQIIYRVWITTYSATSSVCRNMCLWGWLNNACCPFILYRYILNINITQKNNLYFRLTRTLISNKSVDKKKHIDSVVIQITLLNCLSKQNFYNSLIIAEKFKIELSVDFLLTKHLVSNHVHYVHVHHVHVSFFKMFLTF